MIFGITLDDPWKTKPIVDFLKSLPKRIAVRVVFDEQCKAVDYLDEVAEIAKHASIMGELLDSFFVKDYTLAKYERRAHDFFTTLKNHVSIWEIGNEANGDWLGENAAAKFEAAHKVIHGGGGKTALTLYMDGRETWERWALDHVPYIMGSTLDLVLMSDYPHENGGYLCNWPSVIERMGRIFPNSDLGIGECGMDPRKYSSDQRKACFDRYYRKTAQAITHERFMGGFFHWFQAEFIGKNAPLSDEFRALLQAT